MPKTNANLIWKIADLLRGPYQPNQYGDVILPFTILRRLDCILEPTKDEVLAEYKKIQATKVDPAVMLKAKFKLPFYNTSRWTFAALVGDPEGVADNLIDYIERFSPNVRDVFDGFRMADLVSDLAKSDRLYLIVKEFAAVDIHPDVVTNHDMGYIFEELIRKFAESNNAQAGDHFTPREVIALMVDILFHTEDDALTKPGTVRTIYDPAAGTGGMLSTAYDHLIEMNPMARPVLYGQDINPRSYSMCKSDMIIKGQDVDNIYLGDTLTDDGFRTKHFDFLLSNPPFGVAWNTQQKAVTDEFEQRGFAGRFGPGLPRVSDGSLLFLMHLISKMQPVKGGEGGSRMAIVLNGSPLFTGGAGSGESNIRQWIIENDLLDAIIALPTDMFYNTGISTYIWILDNNKPARRRDKVQLINAVDMFGKMRKALGSKRKELRPSDIKTICLLYEEHTNEDGGGGDESAVSKIFQCEEFGYSTITVERPLQLRFTLTEAKVEEVLAQKSVENLKDSEKAGLRMALVGLIGWESTSRDEFITKLRDVLRKAGLTKPPAPLMKTIWSTIGERDDAATVVTDSKGNPEPDPSLRDTENVPLTEDIEEYFTREILPHVPNAWIDHDKTKIGYEIPFIRHFYRYSPPRPLEDIHKDLRTLVGEIQALLSEAGA